MTAVTDCELIEIGAEAFRRVVLADTAVVERVTAAVATRRARAGSAPRCHDLPARPPVEAPHTLVDRVRRFLRL